MLAVGLAVAIAAPFLVSVHTKDLLVQAFIYGIFAISFVVLAVILVVTASTGHTLPR